jgi:Fic family protein
VNLEGAYKTTDEATLLESIDSKLEQLLRWTKFQGMQQLKQILETTLDNDTKKLVYELSDGRSSPAIASIVDVSDRTVRDYWKTWAPMGIIEIHPNYKRRYCKIFSLKELGINIPSYDEATAEQNEPTEEE